MKNRIFIVGGGSSINDIDLSFLKNEDVICVNSSIDLVKNPKYFLTMNYSFFLKTDQNPQSFLNRAANCIFCLNNEQYMQNVEGVWHDTRHNIKYVGLEDFTVIETRTKLAPTGFGSNEYEFAHGNNSGFCAIQFALTKGYEEIYLIGFDLGVNERHHYHTLYKTDPSYDAVLLQYKNNLALAITRFKKQNKVKFFTLTHSSLEPILQYVNPNKLIKTTDCDFSKLVIVGYYIIDTPYEKEKEKLEASIKQFNLNYDLVGVPNLGSWQANAKFKANFMLSMLDKHKGKDLCYVDCDAIFNSPPYLFSDYDADVAVRWQSFPWIENECLSDTIFMKNNTKTKALCKLWIKKNGLSDNTINLEQCALGESIKELENKGKLKSKNLPPEYTFIYDLMRSIYPKASPVIEHFQDSIKLKRKSKLNRYIK